jgi:fatty-acid desaturase
MNLDCLTQTSEDPRWDKFRELVVAYLDAAIAENERKEWTPEPWAKFENAVNDLYA